MLRGKSEKWNYVEVGHKIVEREWSVMELSQPAAGGLFTQHAEEVEKVKNEVG